MRQEVLDVAKELFRKGLVEGTSGNVSARASDGTICITPSSVDYEQMQLDDLVVIDLDGNVVEGSRAPSSERAVHLAAYRRFPEVNGVIHSHPIHATMFACAREPIPPVIDEFTVYVGGEVPVAEYGMSGTDDLAEKAVAKLADVGAVLLANHGLVSIGTDVRKALHVATVVERSAQIVWGARLLGKVETIPEEVNTNFGLLYRYVRHNPPQQG